MDKTLYAYDPTLLDGLRRRDRIDVVCPRCGKVRDTTVETIKRVGHTLCLSCVKLIPAENKIVVGQVFGRLVVVVANIDRIDNNGKKVRYCMCQCSCGNMADVRRGDLLSGHTTSCGCYKIELDARTGKDARSHNHNITDERRNSDEFQRKGSFNYLWRKTIFKLYDGCVVCGSKEKLEAHHIESFTYNEALRFDIANGVCLCKTCHKAYHISFMKGYRNPATRESFNEFLAAMKAL